MWFPHRRYSVKGGRFFESLPVVSLNVSNSCRVSPLYNVHLSSLDIKDLAEFANEEQ